MVSMAYLFLYDDDVGLLGLEREKKKGRERKNESLTE